MKVFLALMLLSASLHAQTINQYAGPSSGPANTFLQLSGTKFTGATQVAFGTATDGIFVVVNDTTINYTVPNDAPIGSNIFTVTTPTAVISSSPLAFTMTPSPAFTAPPKPRCIPDQFNSNFHSMVTPGGSTVYSLWCDDQLGLTTWAVSGAPRMELLVIPAACKTFLGSFSWSLSWLQQAWSSCMVQPLNTDQQFGLQMLAFQWTPRLTVTGANQNVYTQNADGTKGRQLVVNNVGEQIAPGATCDGSRLQNAGARFASVAGRVSTDGVTLPAGSFALCSIAYPPAGGFIN